MNQHHLYFFYSGHVACLSFVSAWLENLEKDMRNGLCGADFVRYKTWKWVHGFKIASIILNIFQAILLLSTRGHYTADLILGYKMGELAVEYVPLFESLLHVLPQQLPSSSSSSSSSQQQQPDIVVPQSPSHKQKKGNITFLLSPSIHTHPHLYTSAPRYFRFIVGSILIAAFIIQMEKRFGSQMDQRVLRLFQMWDRNIA